MLSGNTWVQDNEPGTPSACHEWIQPSTGDHYFRNTTNTAWIYHGRINEELGGAVSKGGDMMGGPLLGSHGLPPQADPDFDGTVRQEGLPVALQRHLASLERRLLDRQASEVKRIFASKTQMSAVAQSLAFKAETVSKSWDLGVSEGFSIDLPVFKSDNQIATTDQVLGYGWEIIKAIHYDGSANGDRVFYEFKEVSPRLIKVLERHCQNSGTFGFTARWWILAVR